MVEHSGKWDDDDELGKIVLDFWACERLLSLRILGIQQKNLKARKLNDQIFVFLR